MQVTPAPPVPMTAFVLGWLCLAIWPPVVYWAAKRRRFHGTALLFATLLSLITLVAFAFDVFEHWYRMQVDPFRIGEVSPWMRVSEWKLFVYVGFVVLSCSLTLFGIL